MLWAQLSHTQARLWPQRISARWILWQLVKGCAPLPAFPLWVIYNFLCQPSVTKLSQSHCPSSVAQIGSKSQLDGTKEQKVRAPECFPFTAEAEGMCDVTSLPIAAH